MTVEEYLRTGFEPDAEFVEGKVVERPAAVWEHSRVQSFLASALYVWESDTFFVVAEQRVRTRPDRFRVLSPENRMPDILEIPRISRVRRRICLGNRPGNWQRSDSHAGGRFLCSNRIFATGRLEVDLANAPF